MWVMIIITESKGFDFTGVYLDQWGSEGTGNGQFYYPLAITTDTNGNVYLWDANNRIQKFSSSGS